MNVMNFSGRKSAFVRIQNRPLRNIRSGLLTVGYAVILRWQADVSIVASIPLLYSRTVTILSEVAKIHLEMMS